MTSFVFPVLSGLTFPIGREYQWNTEKQKALSGKRSTLQLMGYPLVHFELVFSLLRDDLTPSDLKSVVGLFNACAAGYDTFLYQDPDFNAVTLMPFATVATGVTAYPTTATYQNSSGPGGPELIQNFNGTPSYYIERFGALPELLTPFVVTNSALQSQDFSSASWTKTNVTVTTNTTVAPDGTTTMDSIVESTSTNVQHIVQQSATVPSGATAVTWSLFVKPSTRSWAILNLVEATGGTAVNVWFNVSTGVVGTISTGANWSAPAASIVAVPDDPGVYLISISATKTNAATTVTFAYFSATADNVSTYTGTTSTVALIAWGAQFAIGVGVSTLYLSTTTVAVTGNGYTLGPTGIFTPTNALTVGGILLWTGSFYYRCEFDDDNINPSKFLNKWWELKKLQFTSVKL